MILRAASLALALVLAAPLAAMAQDRGQQQGSPSSNAGGDDDLLNPGVLDRGATPTPPPTRTQTPSRPNTQSNQTGPSTRTNQGDEDILGGGATTPVPDEVPEQAGDEAELEYTLGGPVTVPPAEVKAEIDRKIGDIEQRAQRYAQERERIDTVARTDPQRAETEVRGAIADSDAEFDRIFDAASRDGAADEVDEVSRAIDGRGPDGRPASNTTGGATGRAVTPAGSTSVWDSPEWKANRSRYLGSSASSYDPSGMYNRYGYEPIGYPSAGTPEGRMSWWQKLLLKSLEGVAEGVKGLSERRANELKRREEKLRREYPEYRAYVEAETRSRIERTAFAKYGGAANGAYDRRLDDLILGPARSGGLTPTGGSTATASGSSGSTDLPTSLGNLRSSPNRPVARLPRKPDPVTGEPRIEIDMKLGEDPIRPIR